LTATCQTICRAGLDMSWETSQANHTRPCNPPHNASVLSQLTGCLVSSQVASATGGLWAADAAWAAAAKRAEMQQASVASATTAFKAAADTPLAQAAHHAWQAAEQRLQVGMVGEVWRRCVTQWKEMEVPHPLAHYSSPAAVTGPGKPHPATHASTVTNHLAGVFPTF
jgi:hypothetical protein